MQGRRRRRHEELAIDQLQALVTRLSYLLEIVIGEGLNGHRATPDEAQLPRWATYSSTSARVTTPMIAPSRCPSTAGAPEASIGTTRSTSSLASTSGNGPSITVLTLAASASGLRKSWSSSPRSCTDPAT